MISAMIVTADESADLAFHITWYVVVFQQDTVLEYLMPPLNLALGLCMMGRATNMIYAVLIEPFGKFGSNVIGTIIRQQPWLITGH